MFYGALVELGEYPPILPGLAGALLVSLLFRSVVGRRLEIGRMHAWLLLISVGIILAVTLTPSRGSLEFGTQGTIGCDLSRIGPAPLSVYARLDDPILNVLLLIPLGATIGYMPTSRARRWLIVAAVLLPIAIETTQALVVILDRACQGGDVFDNLAGLSVGLLGGALWRRLRRGLGS